MAQRVSRAIENIRYKYERWLDDPMRRDIALIAVDALKEAEDEAKKIEEQNQQDSKHNGYTNYPTWRINLEWADDELRSMQDTIEHEGDEGKHRAYEYVNELATDLSNRFDEAVEEGYIDEDSIKSYAIAFSGQVNWYEIAQFAVEDFPKLLKENWPQPVECPDCEGTGWVDELDEDGETVLDSIECERCGGTGEIEEGSDEE